MMWAMECGIVSGKNHKVEQDKQIRWTIRHHYLIVILSFFQSGKPSFEKKVKGRTKGVKK